MATKKRILVLEDVNGSFARCIRQAPKEARKELAAAVRKIAIRLSDEMYDRAPDRSAEAPHVKDAIDWMSRGLAGQAGILADEASQPAAPGSETTQGEVALYNEYKPNAQPFMDPAAAAIENDFKSECARALGRVEQSLSRGVGV